MIKNLIIKNKIKVYHSIDHSIIIYRYRIQVQDTGTGIQSSFITICQAPAKIVRFYVNSPVPASFAPFKIKPYTKATIQAPTTNPRNFNPKPTMLQPKPNHTNISPVSKTTQTIHKLGLMNTKDTLMCLLRGTLYMNQSSNYETSLRTLQPVPNTTNTAQTFQGTHSHYCQM